MVIHHCFFKNLCDRPVLGGPRQQLIGAMNIVGSHHNVDPWGASLHNVFVLLRQATTNNNASAILGVFPCLEMTQGAVQLVVGILSNATGVQHNDISVSVIFGARHSIGLQEPCDSFGVVFVHLTPKGAHDIGLWALATHPVEATDPYGTEPRYWTHNIARECRKAGPAWDRPSYEWQLVLSD